jgi:antitoxin HicB
MTMRYAYPARLEPSDDGSILVSFRDLPEAMTFGGDMMEALASATELPRCGLAHSAQARRARA